MRNLIAIVLAACGAGHENQVAPTPSEPLANSVDLRAKAEAELSSDTPPDYERPMKTKPVDRSKAIALFYSACIADDHYSCRVEAELLDGDPSEVFRTVASECKRGDTLSCRALPLNDKIWLFPDLPGRWGRNPKCTYGYKKECDMAALRIECDTGFPYSCIALTSLAAPDRAIDSQTNRFAAEGCEQGAMNECGYILPAKITAAKRACVALFQCVPLGDLYAAAEQHELERDARERWCQFSTEGLGGCLELAEDYVQKKFPEPVPGRAKALLNYACPKFYPGSDWIVQKHPLCAQALAR